MEGCKLSLRDASRQASAGRGPLGGIAICLVLIMLELSGPPPGRAAEGPAGRPNVLFILTEDQGPQMGVLGTQGMKTPHMDRIARQGVLFRQAYVAYPVCSASKAALYTGLYPHTNGVRHNTYNYHKPAAELTPAERNRPLARRLRIDDRYTTLIERLHAAGYYTGVTHKLHVLPNEKFPYDEFLGDGGGAAVAGFLANARQTDRSWFLMYNIRWPHRPFRNSDRVKIGVDPAEVAPPGHLPDTPVVRQDWAEYLDAIQQADQLVGEGLDALRQSGQLDRTIIVFMGDHGPCFQRGKMAVGDFGLHVPLAIAGPGIPGDRVSDALVSEIDLMPTLLELLGLACPEPMHGMSFAPLLCGASDETPRRWIVGELHHGAQSHDDGMQERSIYDGRYRLIYREGAGKPRDMNADLWQWPQWGNRTYDETIRCKDEFPRAYALLCELHPQALGGMPPEFELYDVQNDPFELENLAAQPEHRETLERLRQALADWARQTGDTFIDHGRILARLSPQGYGEIGRTFLIEPTNTAGRRQVVWSHPAFANRCIYARNDKGIACADLSRPD